MNRVDASKLYTGSNRGKDAAGHIEEQFASWQSLTFSCGARESLLAL
jgi:hypothetical protein